MQNEMFMLVPGHRKQVSYNVGTFWTRKDDSDALNQRQSASAYHETTRIGCRA